MPNVSGYGWITDRDAEILRLRKIEDALGLQTYSIYTTDRVEQWKAQDKYMGYGTWQGTYEFVDKHTHCGSGYTYEQAKDWVSKGNNRSMLRD